MTTATIKDVMFQKEWNGMSIYKLTMANGQTGDIFTKGWEPKVGDDLTYTYDVEKSRIKRQNPNYQGGAPSGGGYKSSYSPKGNSDKDKLIVRQVALKAAVEFSTGTNLKANQVLQVAEIFNDWINIKPRIEEPAPTPAQYREQPAQAQTEQDDDLPF
jgi:hypothetical protein